MGLVVFEHTASPFFIQPTDDYITRGVQLVNVVMVLLHHSGPGRVVKPPYHPKNPEKLEKRLF